MRKFWETVGLKKLFSTKKTMHIIYSVISCLGNDFVFNIFFVIEQNVYNL